MKQTDKQESNNLVRELLLKMPAKAGLKVETATGHANIFVKTNAIKSLSC